MGRDLGKFAMVPHPAQPHPDLTFDVEVVELEPGRWSINYSVSGDIAGLLLPGPATPERRDELWKHSCCEAFFMLPDGHYEEFNLSPSGHWAGYGFDGYRSGMRNTQVPAPQIVVTVTSERLNLSAVVQLESSARPTALGITTVIEEIDGRISWWSLSHPGEQPDFHDPRGWTIAL